MKWKKIVKEKKGNLPELKDIYIFPGMCPVGRMKKTHTKAQKHEILICQVLLLD